MKTKNLKTPRALLSTLCLLGLFVQAAFAEVTPPGVAPTYTLNGVNYTYYYADGTPIPAGTRFFMTLAGGVLINEKNESIGSMYKTQEEAAYFAERARAACAPGAPRAVFGAGPEGDPCSPQNQARANSGVVITGKENAEAAGLPKIGNGPVTIKQAKELHDGSVNPDDSKGVKNGPFNADYNGLKLVKDAKGLDEKAYEAKSMEMTSFLWGIAEVGEKLCKPVGEKHPVSLVSWWSVIKNYIAAEKKRDALVKKRIEILKDKMAAMIADKSNSAMQLKSIEYQIESLNISIDSLSGSLLFSLDTEGPASRSTARLPWRMALLEAATKATKENVIENKDNHKVYDICTKGIKISQAIAEDACKRTKRVMECTQSGENDQTCIEKDVPDPVPGSCEMAQSILPEFQKGPVQDFANLYYINPIPSKPLNENLIRLGKIIDVSISGFPKSDDGNFNWNEPLVSCLEPMMKTIKNNGLVCPADPKAEGYDKAKVADIASKGIQGVAGIQESFVATLVDSAKVSESAQTFLSTMGITGDALKESTKKFQEDWNATDMTIGQPLQRENYFKKVTEIVKTMIAADQVKLSELLKTRARLLKLYEDTKTLFSQPPTPKPAVAQPAPAPQNNGPFVVGPTSSNANPQSPAAPAAAPANTQWQCAWNLVEFPRTPPGTTCNLERANTQQNNNGHIWKCSCEGNKCAWSTTPPPAAPTQTCNSNYQKTAVNGKVWKCNCSHVSNAANSTPAATPAPSTATKPATQTPATATAPAATTPVTSTATGTQNAPYVAPKPTGIVKSPTPGRTTTTITAPAPAAGTKVVNE